MTLPTRRSIITGLGAGTGLAAAGLLPQSPAIADDSARDFGSPIFDEQFSQGPDFSPSRWRDNRSEPETCASYDWGVFTHDTHSVSDGVGHLLWRKRATPLKGFQNRFDKEETIRYVNQAFVTTEGLFSFVYGSLETRARFPQSHQGLFAGIWLRADDGKNGGEIDVVETYGGGSTTVKPGAREATWGSRRNPISPHGTPTGWRRPPRASGSSSTVGRIMRCGAQTPRRSSTPASAQARHTTSA